MSDATDSRRDLWRAVIDQAVRDACSRSDDKNERAASTRARAWLSRRSADLDEVCGLADVEPDAVIRRAAAIIAEDEIRRADGKRRAFKKDRALDKPKAGPKRIELNGLNLTIAEWAAHTGINKATIASRLNQGWDHERTLTQPSDHGWAWRNTHKLKLSTSGGNGPKHRGSNPASPDYVR